jgi:hypothetical protein
MSVSVGAAPQVSEMEQDIQSAMAGGTNFVERLAKMAEERQRNQEALAALQLEGSARDLVAANREKEALLNSQVAQAEALLAEQNKLVADTRTAAADMLRHAAAEADEFRTQAKAELAEARAARDLAVADRAALAKQMQAAADQGGRYSDLNAKEIAMLSMYRDHFDRLTASLSLRG